MILLLEWCCHHFPRMRIHHSQSGCEDSQQPKNTGSSGTTGSHGSSRTSWGDAAGIFFLFFNAAGSMPGTHERAIGTVAALAMRHGWTLQKSISARNKGKRCKAMCSLNVKPPSILETGGVSAEGGELLMLLQPYVSCLCCPRVPPRAVAGPALICCSPPFTSLSPRPGKTTFSLQWTCRHCYCRWGNRYHPEVPLGGSLPAGLA